MKTQDYYLKQNFSEFCKEYKESFKNPEAIWNIFDSED